MGAEKLHTNPQFYHFKKVLKGNILSEEKTGSESYLWGFNGKLKDSEIYGEGNAYDYGMRMYDPRICRFFSVDPVSKDYPMLTPYQFASNTPIMAIDLDGLEAVIVIKDGWFLEQINKALENDDIELATNLVFASIHIQLKGTSQSSFTADPNKIAGFNVYDDKGNSLFGVSDNIFYSDNISKAKYFESYAAYIDNDLTNIEENIKIRQGRINVLNDEWDYWNKVLTSEDDAGDGVRMSRAIILGNIEIKRDALKHQVETLNAEKTKLTEQKNDLLKSKEEYEKKDKETEGN